MTRLKREKDLTSEHDEDVRFGTPKDVAEYRAERLCSEAETVIEVGAGAGFQTRSFAKRVAKVVAIDIDESRLARGDFAENVHVIMGDALDPSVIEEARKESEGKVVIFLDPERPAASDSRTLDEIRPAPGLFVERYSGISTDIAIELPPFLAHVPWDGEHEYLSVEGELNRHTIYLGSLKRCDVSVVALPGKHRIGHSGQLRKLDPQSIDGKYILEPDRALSHAGLVANALPGRYNALHLGNKQVYLTMEKKEDFFTPYKIIGSGSKEDILPLLERCETVILHGSLEQDAQKRMLKELNRHCRGKERLHIFLADRWYLARRDSGKAL